MHVARQVLDEAERELTAGLAAQAAPATEVAVQRRGAALAARPDSPRARRRGRRARRVRARAGRARPADTSTRASAARNTWYAIGALHLRQGRRDEARGRVRRRRLQRCAAPSAGRASAKRRRTATRGAPDPARVRWRRCLLRRAALARDRGSAAHRAAADSRRSRRWHPLPHEPAGWLLPVEPLLNVSARPHPTGTTALARLRHARCLKESGLFRRPSRTSALRPKAPIFRTFQAGRQDFPMPAHAPCGMEVSMRMPVVIVLLLLVAVPSAAQSVIVRLPCQRSSAWQGPGSASPACLTASLIRCASITRTCGR